MPRGRTKHGDAMRERIYLRLAASSARPPTYREIADEIGIGINAVRHHVAGLVADGLVERTPRVSRGLRVVRPYPSDEDRP